MAEIETSLPDISPRDIVTVLFKRKRAILTVYGSILLVTALYCLLWPPKYAASVRILIKNDRQDPVISADQQSVQMLSRPTVTATDLNSEVAVIRSQTVLERTVRDLRLDEGRPHWALRALEWPMARVTDFYSWIHHEESPGAFDTAVRRLARNLTVRPETKSAVIEVRLLSGSPESATEILERLTNNYLVHRLNVRREPHILKLFEKQMTEKKAALERIEGEIEYVRSGTSSPVIQRELDLAIEQAALFEAESRKAKAQEAELRARMSSYEKQLRELPSRVVTESRSSLALGSLKQRVVELQLRRIELLQKYQPDSRLVQQTEEELAEALAMLEDPKGSVYSEETSDVNDVAREIGEQLALDRARLQAVIALQRATEREAKTYHESVLALKRDARRVAQLERDARTAEESYLQYAQQYEEARVYHEMDRTQLFNVAAIEPVRADKSPAKPRTGFLLKMAFAVGGMLALGFGFALELLDHRVKSPEDVGKYLHVPVLATLERYD